MEMTLGERIRKARKGKMTQAELAELIGVHEITIRRWELGERLPDTDSLKKISQVLGVSVSELMGEEDLTTGLPEVKSKRGIFPSLAYWGEVADNARLVAKGGQNLSLIYTLLSDAAGTIKTAMSGKALATA